MSAGTLPMRMLLLVAVTPPAVAYVAPSPLLRPQAVAAAGQTLSRGGILRGGAQGNVRRRPQAQGTLRSSVFPLPLAQASHGIRLARGAHGLRMAASTTGEAAAVSQEAPEELPLWPPCPCPTCSCFSSSSSSCRPRRAQPSPQARMAERRPPWPWPQPVPWSPLQAICHWRRGHSGHSWALHRQSLTLHPSPSLP